MDWFGGRNAVVTGAAHGIGEAVARRLAELGARVVAVDRDDAALRDAFADEPMIASWHGDLGSSNVAALAEEIWARFGPVELLVNNVGINTPHGYLDLTERDFDFVFQTNCRGPWFFTQRIVAELTAEGHRGAIVFISSLHDHIVHRRPHYSASKAAVAMLVRELAHELGPSGIRVNAVSPGLVQSDSVQPPHPAEEPRIRRLIPLGRIGQPEDVAALAAVLLSEQCSGYVTGVNVAVDGGLGLYTWSQDK